MLSGVSTNCRIDWTRPAAAVVRAQATAGVGLSESVRLARGPASRTLVCIAPAAALAAMGRYELALGAAVAGGLVNAAWAYRAEGGLRGSSGT